jgi:hypothetical protein
LDVAVEALEAELAMELAVLDLLQDAAGLEVDGLEMGMRRPTSSTGSGIPGPTTNTGSRPKEEVGHGGAYRNDDDRGGRG